MCLRTMNCEFWVRSTEDSGDRRCWLKKSYSGAEAHPSRRGHMREAFIFRSMTYSRVLYCLAGLMQPQSDAQTRAEGAAGPLVWDWFLGRGGAARALFAGGREIGLSLVSFEIDNRSIEFTRPDLERYGPVQVTIPTAAAEM